MADTPESDGEAAIRRASRNWLLLMAAGAPLLILGYILIARGQGVAALIIGVPMLIGVWPLRKRLGID